MNVRLVIKKQNQKDLSKNETFIIDFKMRSS